MTRLARGEVFDPGEISVFHCINRCVRRGFLCGRDPVSGRDFEHRKGWLEQRLERLAGLFGIDVLGFSVMSNHFHLVLRNRPDVVATWHDREVARRWLSLCPLRKTPDGEPEPPTDVELANLAANRDRLAELRLRLSDISWLMRMMAEPVARRANAEDQVTGRFWEGRFRAVKLCDEAAILACCVYVDLNPIRAGLAETPESSEFTSARRRIQAARGSRRREAAPDAWLAPLPLDGSPLGPAASANPARCSDRGFLPMSAVDYFELLDWTGRRLAPGKRGAIPAAAPPILARLQLDEQSWLKLARHFGRLFHRIAARPPVAVQQRSRQGRRFWPGQAELLATVG